MTPPHKLFRLLVLGGSVLAGTSGCGGGTGTDTSKQGSTLGTTHTRVLSDGGTVTEGGEGTGPRMW